MTATMAPSLTSTDRCDRCGARAYYRAVLSSGGELLFCAHHGRIHLPALQAQCRRIVDETDQLAELPLPGDDD